MIKLRLSKILRLYLVSEKEKPKIKILIKTFLLFPVMVLVMACIYILLFIFFPKLNEIIEEYPNLYYGFPIIIFLVIFIIQFLWLTSKANKYKCSACGKVYNECVLDCETAVLECGGCGYKTSINDVFNIREIKLVSELILKSRKRSKEEKEEIKKLKIKEPQKVS